MPTPRPSDLLADIERAADRGDLQNVKDELFLKAITHIAIQMENIEGSLTLLATSFESDISQLANEVGEIAVSLNKA